MVNKIIDNVWDDTPVDVTAEANFIWAIANKLRGSYMRCYYSYDNNTKIRVCIGGNKR